MTKGFGITFFINQYTRYFEYFLDNTKTHLFLLVGSSFSVPGIMSIKNMECRGFPNRPKRKKPIITNNIWINLTARTSAPLTRQV